MIELERNLLLGELSMSMSYKSKSKSIKGKSSKSSKGSKSNSKSKSKGKSKGKDNGTSNGNSKEGAYGTNSPNSSPNQQSPTSPSASTPTVTYPSSSGTPYPTFVQAPAQTPSTFSPSLSGTTKPTVVGNAPTPTPQPAVSEPSVVTTFPVSDDFFGDFTEYPTTDDIFFQPPISSTTVFDVSEVTGGVMVVPPPHDVTTVVRMEILYLVEAFVNETEEFEADLDWRIFAAAVVASLGAENSGVLEEYTLYEPTKRRLTERELLSSSTYQSKCNVNLNAAGCRMEYLLPLFLLITETFVPTGSCNSSIVDAGCYIMEADILYILNGNTNADLAAYKAYLALNDEMSSFDEGLPHVARVEYLAPLPILPPNPREDQPNPGDAFLTSGKSSISFNRWTVGAAVAMSTGGLMALMVWNRNRRTRNRRHIQLLEDISVNPPMANPPEQAQREIVVHPL